MQTAYTLKLMRPMDLKKAKILLAKANSLFENMNADSSNVAQIEVDLMRSYLRDLYEAFQEIPATLVVEKMSPPVPRETVEIIEEEIVVPPPPPPAPKPRPKPRIIEIPESIKKEMEAKKPEPAPEPEPIAPPPPPAPAPKPAKAKSEKISADVEDLFEQPQAKELSEKLSELPITDLTKAMGLNERIFTINELFGGNQDAFADALKELNTYASFEDAKEYLMGLATDFKWASKNKTKKARNFIKLIRRRY